MANIAQRVWNASQRYRKHEAIVASDARLTYGDLASLVRGIQNQILATNPTPARVGIMTDDSVYSYAAIIAVLALGAAYVPINSKNPARRNADVIKRAGVDFVFAHESDYQKHYELVDTKLPDFVNVRECRPDDKPWTIKTVPDNSLAYIMFTSGSTGHPKGVPITHGNLIAFSNATFGSAPYEIAPSDRFLQMFELTFDLSVICYLIPLLHGATTCIVPEQGIGFMNVANTLVNERITTALMVPSMLSYLKKFMSELELPDLRLSLFCGEALPRDLLILWSQCVPNARIENTYGPTEATIFCSRFACSENLDPDDVYQGVVSIGSALENVELLILGDNDEILPPGQRGELCIAGPQVMDGYWNDPDKTRAAMLEVTPKERSLVAYRTGDIAFENERGHFLFCGRKDSQIKIDGHRVELGEIEHQAREFLGHGMVAVLHVDGPGQQKRLVLFAESDCKTGREQLNNYLADRLPLYMRPSHVEFLSRMPLNMNGKIDRPALTRSYEAQNHD